MVENQPKAVSSDLSKQESLQPAISIDAVDFTRQYHGVKDSDYILPSDVGEQARLEQQILVLKKLFIIDCDSKSSDVVCEGARELLDTPGQKVLDIGCANGWWLNSVGKAYPAAELYGVDLAPSVVEAATQYLPQAKFFAENVVTGLSFDDNTFDYVHQRYLVFGLPKNQYPAVIRELIRVTKSGGWIELVEPDVNTFNAGPVDKQLTTAVHGLIAYRELDKSLGSNLENHIIEAIKDTNIHTDNIKKSTISLPYNWDGPIGEMVARDFKEAYGNMEDYLHKQLGITREEYRNLVDSLFNEWKSFKTFSKYKDFLLDSFDATEYANRIIQTPDGNEFHRTDIASALAKLSLSIDHLNKELHDQVATHYEDLLQQVANLDVLETSLESIRDGINTVNSSFGRVKTKIREMYQQIKDQTDELELVQAGTDMLRHIQRFFALTRRLEVYLNEGGSPGLSQAAGCVKEIEMLLAEVDLTGIEIVDPEIVKLGSLKASIISQGSKELEEGLKSQNQVVIASGLQIFYNLGEISKKTKYIVDEFLTTINKEIQSALNVQTLSKEIKEKHAQTAQGKKGVEIVNVSGLEYTSNLWKRLESLMDILYENTIKCYNLERVLSRKRDPLTQAAYIDQIVEDDMNGVHIVKYYWKSVSQMFEKEIRTAVKFGYPKLLRLFHDLFSRLNIINTSSLNPSTTQNQIKNLENTWTKNFAESTILLKALASFETAYLRESLARLLDPVNQAFPEKSASSSSLSSRPGPTSGRDNVEKLLRAISREFEISKFDTHLFKPVIKNAQKAVNMYTMRSEHSVAADSSVFNVPSGSGTTAASATPSQMVNIDVINSLWALADGIWNIVEDFESHQDELEDGFASGGLLNESIDAVQKLVQSVAESLIAGITRDVELTMVKIHKEDFNRSSKVAANDQSLSQYVIEVGSKLRWVQREIMSRLYCGDDTKEWYKAVGTRLIDFFLRQASLIRPLNTEVGKLKLTTDMTQLEFILNQWISPTSLKLDVAMGSSYKALRSFRQLLFLDMSQVAATHHTADIPKVVVAHHLIVRAHPLIHLPITAFGWTELGYSDWLDVHSEDDAVKLLGQCLNMYMDDVRKQGGREYRVEFVA
ncbi:Conserved oligomeric Golgi complex subunit, partial [Physocladia obscura]